MLALREAGKDTILHTAAAFPNTASFCMARLASTSAMLRNGRIR